MVWLGKKSHGLTLAKSSVRVTLNMILLAEKKTTRFLNSRTAALSRDDNRSFLHSDPGRGQGLVRGGKVLRAERPGGAGTGPLFRPSVADRD